MVFVANRHARSGAYIPYDGGRKSRGKSAGIIRDASFPLHIHHVSIKGSFLKLFSSASLSCYASVTAAMLVRGQKRVACFLIPFTILVLLTVAFYVQHLVAVPSLLRQWSKDASSTWQDYRQLSSGSEEPVPQKPLPHHPGNGDVDVSTTHNEVFSALRRDGKYFMIEFGNHEAINPNIIPHPTLNETWIIIAMQPAAESSVKNSVWYIELVCEATFTQKGSLACKDSPMLLPIAATASPHCTGDLEYFKFNVGPHDGRVFYGPEVPYTIYGSNSAYTCFGQWIQDFRRLVDWGYEPNTPEDFHLPTDLQRPPPYHPIEKNYFLFWSSTGDMYAHYDISPQRSFALLSPDGSVGPDLAALSSTQDSTCMAQYMPSLAPSLESIHQATNSLSITLCNRTDPSCYPDPTNTFIMTIFQHKTFYRFHSVYEPYILLFDSAPPFAVHAISSKPIWIHGRGKAGETRPKNLHLEKGDPWNQTEMFYVTSMAWKEQGMKYHGFLDDVVFLAFGIEDERTAGIDVRAGDLVRGLGLCSDVGGGVGDVDQNGSDMWGLEGGDVGAGLGDVLG